MLLFFFQLFIHILRFFFLKQTDSLTASYTQRAASQQQQQQQPQQQLSGNVSGGATSVGSAGSNALDQLTKNDPYSQNTNTASAYQSSYQSSSNVVSNKGVLNAYQPSVASQGYNNSAYGNVQVRKCLIFKNFCNFTKKLFLLSSLLLQIPINLKPTVHINKIR